jgi:hypothetical protein
VQESLDVVVHGLPLDQRRHEVVTRP